jgi:hypothetical protein
MNNIKIPYFIQIPLDKLITDFHNKIKYLTIEQLKDYLNASIAEENFYVTKLSIMINKEIPFEDWTTKDKQILALACSCPVYNQKRSTIEQKKSIRLLTYLVYKPKNHPGAYKLLSYATNLSYDKLKEINHLAEAVRDRLIKRIRRGIKF